MKFTHPNIGSLDRSIRIVLALASIAIYTIKIVHHNYNWLLLAIAIVLLVSAITKYCPIYSIWEFSSTEKEENY